MCSRGCPNSTLSVVMYSWVSPLNSSSNLRTTSSLSCTGGISARLSFNANSSSIFWPEYAVVVLGAPWHASRCFPSIFYISRVCRKVLDKWSRSSKIWNSSKVIPCAYKEFLAALRSAMLALLLKYESMRSQKIAIPLCSCLMRSRVMIFLVRMDCPMRGRSGIHLKIV